MRCKHTSIKYASAKGLISLSVNESTNDDLLRDDEARILRMRNLNKQTRYGKYEVIALLGKHILYMILCPIIRLFVGKFYYRVQTILFRITSNDDDKSIRQNYVREILRIRRMEFYSN